MKQNMTKLNLPKVRGALSFDYDMSRLSWLRVGGPADVLFQPTDLEDLQLFLSGLNASVPVFPIGVCSNLIIRDGGIDGVVIRLGREFNEIEILNDNCVRAGVGALDAHVAQKAAQNGIDLAFLRTIPGAIGGAIKMNAGCYGVYMADVFVEAQAVTRAGSVVTLRKQDLAFSYRNIDLPEGCILTSVLLKGAAADPATLEVKMENALATREATQPTKKRSCGSTFRNPAGFSSTGQADDIQNLKAWKLIDDAGLRGASIGGAQMSELHSNFLINKGGATAADLENLGEMVRKRVFEDCGLTLEWEIVRIGKTAQ